MQRAIHLIGFRKEGAVLRPVNIPCMSAVDAWAALWTSAVREDSPEVSSKAHSAACRTMCCSIMSWEGHFMVIPLAWSCPKFTAIRGTLQ